MKTIGIIILFFTIASLGFFISEKYLSLLKDIKRVDYFIKNILLGLESENMTVSEIFEITKKSGDEKTNNFLNSVSPENFQDISEISFNTDFCKDQTVNSILSEVFFVFGKYSASEQIKEINFCRSKILAYYEKKEVVFLEKAKLSKYSGILAGIFAAIILI